MTIPLSAALPHLGRRMLVALAVLGAVGVAGLAADGDTATDLAAVVARWGSSAFAALTWPVLAVLVVVSGLHYVAAAVATRAAAGTRLPFGELVAAQFAASAANRVTPAGLGGAGLLGRYLTRRGLAPAQATAAVSALAVLGGVADVLAFAALVGAGLIFGLAGASSEVPLLVSRLTALVPLPSGPWWWAVAGGALLVAAVVALPRLRRATLASRSASAAAQFRRAVGDLARHPGRVLALMGSSAATTLLLAAGFAAASTFGPAGLPSAGFVALMIGYMIASAAGNALPTPGGIGTADAALVGVLLAANAPGAAALATVLAFRIVTFWAPALAGLALVRTLRHRCAL